VLELVGWHLCRGDAAMDAADIAVARSLGTKVAHFAIDCNRTATAAYFEQTGETGISLPDPTAMAVALDPAVVTSASSHAVAVECHSELTRGQTIVDQLNVSTDERNSAIWEAEQAARVVWSIDVPMFKRMLLASMQ
jgi:purine nucleosidase